MLAAAIIVFREMFEAGLIVGIVLAVTRGLQGSRLGVTLGVAAGLFGSIVLACFMGAIAGAFDGSGQDVLNAVILGTAVAMLAWHNVWMARHGREIAMQLKAAGSAVATGARPMIALSVVVAAAVLREGAEVVLFLYGVSVSEGSSLLTTIGGAALGAALGGTVTVLAYLGLVTIPARRVFTVTTVMITLLAAGMAAQAAGFLEQAGVTELLGQTAWNSSGILSDASMVGRVLHTLIGYTDQPTVLQVMVYVVVLATIALATRVLAPVQVPRPATLAPSGQAA